MLFSVQNDARVLRAPPDHQRRPVIVGHCTHAAALQCDVVKADMKKFDLSSQDQRDQFDKNYKLAQGEQLFDQKYKTDMFDMAKTQFTETVREFDVTNENDMTKFNEMQTWEREKFDFGKDKQIEFVSAQIDSLKSGTKDAEVQAQLGNFVTILKDPAIRNYLDSSGATADSVKFGDFMNEAITAIMSGDPEAFPDGKTLLDAIKAGQSGAGAITAAKEAIKGYTFNDPRNPGKWTNITTGSTLTNDEYQTLRDKATGKTTTTTTPKTTETTTTGTGTKPASSMT
jgi:hypothetical protein